MKRVLISGLLGATIAACSSGTNHGTAGTNHEIAASEFQRSCSTDSDCVPVYEGGLSCCGPRCPNAAVNQVGYADYQSAVSSRTPTCSPALPCAALSCAARAACSNGTCVFDLSATDAGGQNCPFGCPATDAGATIAVTANPAMAVTGVQATLTGPVSGTMSCEPNGSAILCRWPLGVVVTQGSYSLEVSAPGYQTTTVQVQVIVSGSTCGCIGSSIQPDTVELSPGDGGSG